MRIFKRETILPASPREVYEWHLRPGAFKRLIPPWENMRLVHDPGAIKEGDTLTMVINRGPLKFRWTARHVDLREGRSFVDEQVKGPFAHWRHSHEFIPEGEGSTRLKDKVEYALPLSTLSEPLMKGAVDRMLGRMFAFRHDRLSADIEAHEKFRDRPRLNVAVTGAGGVVGSALSAFLHTGGHRVKRMVRAKVPSSSDAVFWDPATGEVETEKLNGLDALVHLAGENLTSGRWDEAKKRKIESSRADATRKLCEALAEMDDPPRTLIQAGAVGYYGDCPADEVCVEGREAGHGFLGRVCREWEAASEVAQKGGIRVVILRIGVALALTGGALKEMVLPFKLGLGGPAGTGGQCISWIHLDDVVYAIHHALYQNSMSGPYNLTAPEPATNREFAKTLARVLHRPAFLKTPEFMIRAIYGEMGKTLLLEGARVDSSALRQTGFEFSRPDLEDALRYELGKH